jgi:hypothetical protein
MAPREFTISLRVDHYKDDKDQVTRDLVRMAAKHLYTQAMLLQDRRPPQITVSSSDMFDSTNDIKLVDDQLLEEPEPEAKTGEGARTHNAELARVGGYTVSDKGNGWRFNDPDGKWSDLPFTTEGFAWEGAYADSLAKAG